MSLLHNIAGGLRGLFRKEEVEQELDEELRGYLDASVREKVAAGMNPDAALRAARQEFGSLEGVKENIRAAGWESIVEAFWQDLRFGARLLRKSPGFTVVAVLTLALGIGATTAMFSVIDRVLLNLLPFPQPDQLVDLYEKYPTMSKATVTYPNFLDWQRDNQYATFQRLWLGGVRSALSHPRQ